MTMQEAEALMERLRHIFPIVRLLKEHEVPTDRTDINPGGVEDGCQCFSFWKKHQPCANCITREVLQTRGQKTKIEFAEDEMYQVISKYVEVDGEDCVIEMLEPLDEDTLMDSGGREKLMRRLSGYDDQLYFSRLFRKQKGVSPSQYRKRQPLA